MWELVITNGQVSYRHVSLAGWEIICSQFDNHRTRTLFSPAEEFFNLSPASIYTAIAQADEIIKFYTGLDRGFTNELSLS